MITTSRTLEDILQLFGRKKTSTRPMWAWEVESTRYNAAVWGRSGRNTRAIRALDMFLTITVAIVLASVLVIPTPTSYMTPLSFIAIALIGAVCGGRMIFRASILSTIFATLFEAGFALGEPIILQVVMIWGVLYLAQRGLNEAFNCLVYFLDFRTLNLFSYDCYKQFRRGTGNHAHFPNIFLAAQLLALFSFFLLSWQSFISRGTTYPFTLMLTHALSMAIYVIPQAFCIAIVKNSWDTACLIRQRCWDNYQADILVTKDVTKAMVLGFAVALVAPMVLFILLYDSVDVKRILIESGISTGIVLLSYCIVPLYRFLLSTPQGGGVLVATPAIDRCLYPFEKKLDYKYDPKKKNVDC